LESERAPGALADIKLVIKHIEKCLKEISFLNELCHPTVWMIIESNMTRAAENIWTNTVAYFQKKRPRLIIRHLQDGPDDHLGCQTDGTTKPAMFAELQSRIHDGRIRFRNKIITVGQESNPKQVDNCDDIRLELCKQLQRAKAYAYSTSTGKKKFVFETKSRRDGVYMKDDLLLVLAMTVYYFWQTQMSKLLLVHNKI
jgi:hypothetical protein